MELYKSERKEVPKLGDALGIVRGIELDISTYESGSSVKY